MTLTPSPASLDLLLLAHEHSDAARLAEEMRTLGHDVRTASDGASGLQAIDRRAFTAILIDRALPGMDGIATVERLRAAGKTLPVIILSAGRGADAVRALAAGADDHVVLPVTAGEIDARLRAILRGRQYAGAGSDTIAAGEIVISPTTFRAWQDGRPLELGRLEFGLLAAFVRDAGAVLSRATLLRQVWGQTTATGVNVVDAQVCGLRTKLAATGGRSRIITVRGVGYVLRDDDAPPP